MFKNYLLIFLMLSLMSCSTPGSALLGPAFTGATAKSVAQAALSFGTNQDIRKDNAAHIKSKKKVEKIAKKIEGFEFKSKYNKFFHFYK